MREEFRDIKSFEGIYKISSLGRVLSVERIAKDGRKISPRIIKYRTNNKQYITVDLFGEDGKNHKKLIHRLMAEAFISNPDPSIYTEVGHKNGIRTDNRLDNLEWQTSDFNLADRHARQKEFKEVLKAQRGMKIIENKREESEWNKKYSFIELFGIE